MLARDVRSRGAGGQPEGEPGVGRGEVTRGLGEIPRAPPAWPEGWFGIPSWEPTRCLRLGARDGFAHWMIVGSVAPRRLIYAHEFARDRGRPGVAAAPEGLRLVQRRRSPGGRRGPR